MTTTYNVSSEGATFGNIDTMTLNGVIRTIATAPALDNYVINITGNISLTSELLAINLPSGSTLDIEGNGFKLDGGGSQRGLFVYSGVVTIEDLTLANMLAQGGAGGDKAGGGAGLGGALFIADDSAHGAAPGNVTLNDVTFVNDTAAGGSGGAGALSGGGGGGLGGPGGTSTLNDGAGGGGVGVAGAAGGTLTTGGSVGASGTPGIIVNAAPGGDGGGDGGGGGASGGGGGAGGFVGGGTGPSFGRAGGGGGGIGGAPGIGGGSIGGGHGGSGGYGGGGGAGNSSNGGGGGGSGGFGGGGLRAGGGGGLGAGGDIFVQAGASLTIAGTDSVAAGTVTPGAGGLGASFSPNGQSGEAFASGIYLQGNNTLTFTPTGTQTIAGVIGDDAGSAAAAGYSAPFGYTEGSVGIVINGTGTLLLEANNTYKGTSTIERGTLELAPGATAGTGTIAFGGPAATLQIDAPVTAMQSFTNTLADLAAGDRIDPDRSTRLDI
jgi:hypothetical protein